VTPGTSAFKQPLAAGDFVRLAYRLGRSGATGVLSLQAAWQRPEILVLRRGALVTIESDVHGRIAIARLARMAALTGATASFDGGAQTHPPGARGLPLVVWARQHLEAQLDQARADVLTAELAGVRLSVRPEQLPDASVLDEADRRIVAAMTQPRRLDQIWPLARTPRFRLLCFLHFLRQVGAVTLAGVGAADAVPRAPADARTSAAKRTLGISGGALDRDTVKRAYRRLARALHPDLQPGVSDLRRRELEARLREVTAAAEALLA
jgi:hypothetical protein